MGGDLPQHLMVATDAVPATAVDGDGVRPVGPPTHRHSLGSWSPSPSLITGLAFAVVAVPFGIAVIRLLAAPGGHVYLPDDLALIDLHTRRALQWKQQLGVFDHNEWNHPGPSYFYLLSVAYRILGSGAKAMFVGATLINAGAALACVGVVRRRASPARALWAAAWLCVLASLLAAVGPGSVAYSEGALGGLVSPWNPMVVIFPLVLLLLLCAGAMDRSVLSLVGALVVGSWWSTGGTTSARRGRVGGCGCGAPWAGRSSCSCGCPRSSSNSPTIPGTSPCSTGSSPHPTPGTASRPGSTPWWRWTAS
jgi:hypothetical protein